MRVLITGGAGFIGRLLAKDILARGTLADSRGDQAAVSELILFDTAAPNPAIDGAQTIVGDITEGRSLDEVFSSRIDSVFHLAAVVSAAAEEDFDLGMRVNFDGSRMLIERCARQSERPRFVFSSSVAVFGSIAGDVTDMTLPMPRSSYGCQKVMAEYLVEDCSRRGMIDGRTVRFPTIAVRPGRPNKAASSFVSSIIREPLAGERAVCPVPLDTAVFIGSPGTASKSLLHAHDLPGERFEGRRTLNLPGVSVTVGEMIEALGRAGGDVGLISHAPDPAIERIVADWPPFMVADRARELGFPNDSSIDGIVGDHLASCGRT